MTEEQWLACDGTPAARLRALRARLTPAERRALRRKLLLFACAGIRRLNQLLADQGVRRWTERAGRLVDLAGRAADATSTHRDRRWTAALRDLATLAWPRAGGEPGRRSVCHVLARLLRRWGRQGRHPPPIAGRKCTSLSASTASASPSRATSVPTTTTSPGRSCSPSHSRAFIPGNNRS